MRSSIPELANLFSSSKMDEDQSEPGTTTPHLLRLKQPQALRMVNGNSPLHSSISAQERDELAASIDRSEYEKRPLDIEELDEDPALENGTESARISPKRTSPHNRASSRLSEPARDTRDTAPSQPSPFTSRPASPYVQKAIDFDGLSWPSMYPGNLPSNLSDVSSGRYS